jgi:hypothetical protein
MTAHQLLQVLIMLPQQSELNQSAAMDAGLRFAWAGDDSIAMDVCFRLGPKHL